MQISLIIGPRTISSVGDIIWWTPLVFLANGEKDGALHAA
ncbi:MAG: hypothetical protein JW384_03108 [Nitrosomonadaceae bacterium]|nr:hypothetical protein [Nitrosomonadaceae bacterium]